MPDKTVLDGFLIAHDVFDLAGSGGYNTSAPPRVPGTDDLMDDPPFPEVPDEDHPSLANVLWDFDESQLFAFDEDEQLTQISPFDLSVYYDPDTQTLNYWDAPNEVFVPIDLGDIFGDQVQLVFTSPPRGVAADEESSGVTIERRDILDNPITTGITTVYLYSTDPDLIFYLSGVEVDTVDIEDAESSFTVTFRTPTAGNPVITASTEVLA